MYKNKISLIGFLFNITGMVKKCCALRGALDNGNSFRMDSFKLTPSEPVPPPGATKFPPPVPVVAKQV